MLNDLKRSENVRDNIRISIDLGDGGANSLNSGLLILTEVV